MTRRLSRTVFGVTIAYGVVYLVLTGIMALGLCRSPSFGVGLAGTLVFFGLLFLSIWAARARTPIHS